MVRNTSLYYLLATYRWWRNDWRGAAKNYHKVFEKHKSSKSIRHKYLRALFKAKQYEKLTTLITDDEDDQRLARLKVHAFLRLQDHDSAVRVSRHFIKKFPDDYRLALTEASALLRQENYAEAREVYSGIVDTLESTQDSRRSYLYHSVGYTYEMEADMEHANEYYDKALEYSRSQKVAMLGIGVLHQRRGFLDLATHAYEEKLHDDPENAAIFFELGKIYSKQAKTQQAAEAYKKFVEFDEKRPSFNEKMVVFDAYMGRNYACSPRAIYEEMLKDKRFKDFTFVWVMRSSSLTRYWRLYLDRRTRVVKYKSRAYFRAYAEAKYWVTNSRIAFVLKTTPGQVYIQCWHGTPLKKLGHSITDKHMGSKYDKDGLVELYDHETRRFDYLISPSKKYTEFISEAFGLKQLNKQDIVIETGYPRNDFLHNFTKKDTEKIKRSLKIPSDKKVLLYAPTWRDDQRDSERGYTYKTQADFDYLREKIGDDWVILFRAHYFVANLFDFNKYKGFVYNVSDVNDVNDLYIASDALMTDYSSVFFDYANLRRPIIFFMYDLEHYQEDLRGFYIDLGILPGEIVKEEKRIVSILHDLSAYSKKYTKAYEDFCSEYTYLDDGGAAKRVIDKVIH